MWTIIIITPFPVLLYLIGQEGLLDVGTTLPDIPWNILKAEWLSEAGIIALLATIVAILIPVAILLIDPRQNKFPLDRSIVIRNIFLYKNFTLLIIPVAISYVLPQIRLFSLFATLYLAILSMKVLLKMFRWLSSNDDKFGGETFKQKERIEYLRDLKDESEIIDTWSVVLNSDYKAINQHGLLNVFIDSSKNIKNNQRSWNKELFWGLLRDNFDKIKDNDIKTHKKLIRTTISYYVDRDEWRKGGKEERDIRKRPPEALRQISQKLMARAITGDVNSIESYVYFDEVENYLGTKEKQANIFMGAYIPDLIRCFIENDADVYDKWSGKFFNRITITEDNFNKRIAIWRSYYWVILSRYVERPDNPSNEIGKKLSDITEKIFIEIDPIIWFRVITFLRWPYERNEDSYKDAENRIKNWCSRDKNYGVFGRLDTPAIAISGVEEGLREELIEEDIRAEFKNQAEATYGLLVKIFDINLLNFSLYKKVITRLEKEGKGSDIFKARLDIIKKTLAQFSEYINKNNLKK